MKKSLFVVFGLIVLASGGPTGPSSRIVGGGNAPTGWATYIVALHNNINEEYTLFCAASLITKSWCVTAGHCVYNRFESAVDLIAGTNNRNGTGEGAQLRKPAKFFIHPDFVAQVGSLPPQNDIAMIKTVKPFVFNEFVLSIGLPGNKYYPINFADVWGWGSTTNTTVLTQPKRLQNVVVPLKTRGYCEMINYPSQMYDYQICSGAGNKGACVGDSGGPMTQVNNDTGEDFPTLMGIVSYGYFPCGASDRPSVYTLVSYFLDFMQTTIYNNP